MKKKQIKLVKIPAEIAEQLGFGEPKKNLDLQNLQDVPIAYATKDGLVYPDDQQSQESKVISDFDMRMQTLSDMRKWANEGYYDRFVKQPGIPFFIRENPDDVDSTVKSPARGVDVYSMTGPNDVKCENHDGFMTANGTLFNDKEYINNNPNTPRLSAAMAENYNRNFIASNGTLLHDGKYQIPDVDKHSIVLNDELQFSAETEPMLVDMFNTIVSSFATILNDNLKFYLSSVRRNDVRRSAFLNENNLKELKKNSCKYSDEYSSNAVYNDDNPQFIQNKYYDRSSDDNNILAVIIKLIATNRYAVVAYQELMKYSMLHNYFINEYYTFNEDKKKIEYNINPSILNNFTVTFTSLILNAVKEVAKLSVEASHDTNKYGDLMMELTKYPMMAIEEFVLPVLHEAVKRAYVHMEYLARCGISDPDIRDYLKNSYACPITNQYGEDYR